MGLDTTPLPVQELWDCILEFLSKSTPEIRAMALVCRSLCPMAQSQLFYHISFERPTPTPHGGPYDEVAACQRLAEILDHSPHLIPYIRSINLRIELGLHTQIMEMGLINLRCVRLSGYAIFSELDEPGEWTERLARFLGLSSIRRLEITMAGAFPPRIFQYSTSNLTEISFGPATPCHPARIPELEQRVGTSRITKLSLRHSPRVIVDWFKDRACPFDFSELVELDTGSSWTEDLGSIVDSARLTMRRLTFGHVDLPQLDLTHFRLLTRIAMDAYIPGALPVLASALSALSRSLIQHISIRIALFHSDSWAELEATIQRFDAAIALNLLPALPALERIDILLWTLRASQESDPANYAMLFRAAAPELSARRLLFVTVADIEPSLAYPGFWVDECRNPLPGWLGRREGK
ncbi:hypothetical protein DFH09DRAFT_1103122 [Mycena vulgaris]|nr:hypothetical protein DFH09DRAFT_1103122 [Mycena vulgaris]